MDRGNPGFISDKIYDAFTSLVMLFNQVKPAETGRITDSLSVVRTGTANFYTYDTGEGVICFDTGFGKARAAAELCRLGIDPGRVTHVFLTHSDFDHTGGLTLFKNAQIYISSEEEQMITGKKARGLGFIYNFGIAGAYRLLKDNDLVAAGSAGIRALATPGHTPGSMSYLINGSILVVGDTFRIIEGKVQPIKHYNMDTELQKESIRKLAKLDGVDIVCTGHRGYTKEFNEAIGGWK